MSLRVAIAIGAMTAVSGTQLNTRHGQRQVGVADRNAVDDGKYPKPGVTHSLKHTKTKSWNWFGAPIYKVAAVLYPTDEGPAKSWLLDPERGVKEMCETHCHMHGGSMGECQERPQYDPATQAAAEKQGRLTNAEVLKDFQSGEDFKSDTLADLAYWDLNRVSPFRVCETFCEYNSSAEKCIAKETAWKTLEEQSGLHWANDENSYSYILPFPRS